VVANVFTGRASLTVYGFIGLFTGTTYLLAGWAREQVCIYMCPWPRIQGAMFDEHTMLVTYEAWRGEPRSHAKAGQSPEGRGHCIDCGLCVRVCPTGIDIRSGQQLDCIGCGLCIDACNSVMAKMAWPKDLITYDALSNQAAREAGQPLRARFVRPRTLIYAALLVAVASVMLFFLSTRAHLQVTVQPDRAPLFVQLRDGGIQNAYTVKILNKDRTPQTYTLAVDGLAGAEIAVIGHEPGGDGYALPVAGDDVGTFRVLLRANADATRANPLHLEFVVRNRGSGETNEHETVFNGPSS
jgi:cytochrome c oxidase accessory protein FixG